MMSKSDLNSGIMDMDKNMVSSCYRSSESELQNDDSDSKEIFSYIIPGLLVAMLVSKVWFLSEF